MVGQVEEGMRVGTWRGWHRNGQPSFVFEHENGAIRHRTIWHPNGAKRMEGSYIDGQPDGIHVHWDDGEQKVSEETYRAGKLDGVRRLWGPDGALLQTATYKDGQLDGPTVWFFADGSKRWETHYAAGKRAGVWTQWTNAGEVFMQSEWETGALVNRTNPHSGH
jgi:antitoxin component YwqK of YwqJK toxin-antitoxin module